MIPRVVKMVTRCDSYRPQFGELRHWSGHWRDGLADRIGRLFRRRGPGDGIAQYAGFLSHNPHDDNNNNEVSKRSNTAPLTFHQLVLQVAGDMDKLRTAAGVPEVVEIAETDSLAIVGIPRNTYSSSTPPVEYTSTQLAGVGPHFDGHLLV